MAAAAAALLTRSAAVTLTVLVLVALVSSFLCTAASHGARMAGGRTKIENVKTNEEVQELGRFSVKEYSERVRLLWRKEEEELEFVEVVEAQAQVVSGIKCYLNVAATQNGAPRIFDSEVVVKPWLRSKQLLNFAPSSD